MNEIPVCAATFETQANVILNALAIVAIVFMLILLNKMRQTLRDTDEFLSWWRRQLPHPPKKDT